MRQSLQPPRLLALLTLALAIVVTAGAAFAQGTTSSIRGFVRDAAGPVAEAVITATELSSGFHRSVTTSADGAYALPGLAPGTYEILVSSAATAEQRKNIQLLVGHDVQADFLVSPSEVVVEGVTVIGDNVELLLDTRNSGISTNITPDQIAHLPQNNRNFLNFAGLAPGVQYTDNTDAAGQTFRSGGSNPKQVNVFIDGQSYKNDLIQGGAFMQDTSRGNPFPQGAVQEFKVLTQNYKAEYEKASAAVITAVTKSGGNDFHGELFYLFQDKGMVSLDPLADERGDDKPSYERNQYGLSLGGPIQKDKLHFFFSYERNDRDVFSTVTRGGSYNASVPANVRALLDPYETGLLSAPLDSSLYFGKLSWQATDSQVLALSYYGRDEEELRGFGGQRVREGAENFSNQADSFVLRHQWVAGSFFNEASATVQKMQWNPTAIDFSNPHRNYVGLLDVGGRDSSQDIIQDKFAIRDDLSWMLDWHGSHSLKTGITANWVDYDISKTNVGNPYFEYRSAENWQFPFLARFGFGDPSLDFSNEQYGFYFQDDWAVLPNLTVNLGLRYDYETNMVNNDWVTPANVAAGLRNSCRNYATPVGGRTQWCIPDIIDPENFISDGDNRSSYDGMYQPRVGFTWDVKSDGNTVVFGGWGKYYDRVTLNDTFDEQFRQTYKIYGFCFSADGGPVANCNGTPIAWNPAYQSAEGLAGLIASGRTDGPEIFLLPNDMHPPYANQWTLGVRQKLGDWLGSLSYANTQGRNGMAWIFATLPPGAPFNDRFGLWVQIPGYGIVLKATDVRETEYDGIFLTLDKPYTSSSRWGVNVAYTYSEGKQEGTTDEGTAFSFDYRYTSDFRKFPANGDERNRLVASGTIGLPWNFILSSVISLGSGTPYTYTDCSAGFANCITYFNGFRPEKKDFIIPDAWAYRSVDLRLEWEAPVIANLVTISLIGEAFNVFDFENYNGFDGFIPPEGNPNFGKPNSAFNARRFQVGLRASF